MRLTARQMEVNSVMLDIGEPTSLSDIVDRLPHLGKNRVLAILHALIRRGIVTRDVTRGLWGLANGHGDVLIQRTRRVDDLRICSKTA